MSRKNAAVASTVLSLAEYIDNYPGMPEGASAVMLLLKLDIISCLNYAWREAHNKMLLPSATSTKPGHSKEGQKTLTVSVSSDSKKRKVESQDDAPQPPRKPMTPVGGRLSSFVEGWKRVTNDPCVLSIVAKGYRLRFMSPPLLRQTP